MPETLTQQNLNEIALENLLKKIELAKEKSNTSISKKYEKTNKLTETKKPTETVKRKYTKKEKEEIKENEFIPVEIWFYFKWTCPLCKKKNTQEYDNIYNVDGPAWIGPGVVCDKCKKHFNIIDSHKDS